MNPGESATTTLLEFGDAGALTPWTIEVITTYSERDTVNDLFCDITSVPTVAN